MTKRADKWPVIGWWWHHPRNIIRGGLDIVTDKTTKKNKPKAEQETAQPTAVPFNKNRSQETIFLASTQQTRHSEIIWEATNYQELLYLNWHDFFYLEDFLRGIGIMLLKFRFRHSPHIFWNHVSWSQKRKSQGLHLRLTLSLWKFWNCVHLPAILRDLQLHWLDYSCSRAWVPWTILLGYSATNGQRPCLTLNLWKWNVIIAVNFPI